MTMYNETKKITQIQNQFLFGQLTFLELLQVWRDPLKQHLGANETGFLHTRCHFYTLNY